MFVNILRFSLRSTPPPPSKKHNPFAQEYTMHGLVRTDCQRDCDANTEVEKKIWFNEMLTNLRDV